MDLTDAGAEDVPLLLAWPTAGRRRSLLESVEGFARNLAEHGRRLPLLPAVDYRHEDFDPGLSAGIREIAVRYGCPLLISDRSARERFLKRLEKDFDPEFVKYAFLPHLDGRGLGCNLNAVMLAAAGGFAISTDDDVLCVPGVRSGGVRTGALYSKEPFPIDYFFYKNRETLLAGIEKIRVDFVAEHRRFLGAEAGDLASGTSGGRILVTSPGSYGDSGFGRARTVLSLRGRARDFLVNGGYEDLRLSREVVRIAEKPLLGRSMHLMAMQSGYDVREPLPPFLPLGRNPDGFFALVLRILRPSSLTAFLDFGWLHSPPEPRPFGSESLTDFKPYLSELLMALLLRCRPTAGTEDAKKRYYEFGANLREAAALETGDFAHFLHEAWSIGAEAYAGILEGLLETCGGEPRTWAEDAKSHLENVYEKLREPSYLYGDRGCGFTVEQVRNHAASYGRLLGLWPDLHEAAARLNREGLGIAEETPTFPREP